MIGAALYVLLRKTAMPDFISILLSIVVIFAIRCLSAYFKWNLPKAKPVGEIENNEGED